MKTKQPDPGEIEAILVDRVINQIIILQEEEHERQAKTGKTVRR